MSLDIKKNELHDYVDLLRGKEWSETGNALYNVIRTMRLSRHDKVCGEDFSQLDFGNIPFNGVHFSLNGEYPCDFTECILNELNFKSGHSGSVTSVAWSADGKYVLTGSHDCTAILWEAESGLMVRKFVGHTDWIITAVAISPVESDHLCAAGSNHGTVIIWSMNTGKPVHAHPLEYYSYCINSIAFSEDGKRCMASAREAAMICWDVSTGQKAFSTLSKFSSQKSLLSSNGRTFLAYYNDTEKNEVKIYNVDNGEIINAIKLQEIWKDHKIRNVKDDNVISLSYDGEICVLSNYAWRHLEPDDNPHAWGDYYIFLTRCWDIKNNKEIATFQDGHKDIVLTMAMSKDKTLCLTGSKDCTAILWDVKTGKILHRLVDHKSWIRSVCFSPDGTTCITGAMDHTAIVWNVTSGLPISVLRSHASKITTITRSKDGNITLVGSDNGVVSIWDMTTGKMIRYIFPQNNESFFKGAYKMLISNKNHVVMIVYGDEHYDNGISFFDINTGKLLLQVQKQDVDLTTTEIFSPDETFCLIGRKKGAVLFCDLKKGIVERLTTCEVGVKTVLFSGDGKACLTHAGNGIVSIWNIHSKMRNGIFRDIWRIDISRNHDYVMLINNAGVKEIFRFDSTGLSMVRDKTTLINLSTTEFAEQTDSLKLYEKWKEIKQVYKEQNITADSSHISKSTNSVLFGLPDSIVTLWDDCGNQLDTLHQISDLYISNCVCTDVNADDVVRKILYQYGAKIELAD